MSKVIIQLPPFEADSKIDVEVTVNGVKKKYHYRIEILSWEDCEQPEEARVDCLKKMIANYDQDWQLLQIGMPTPKDIPLMFKQKLVKN